MSLERGGESRQTARVSNKQQIIDKKCRRDKKCRTNAVGGYINYEPIIWFKKARFLLQPAKNNPSPCYKLRKMKRNASLLQNV